MQISAFSNPVQYTKATTAKSSTILRLTLPSTLLPISVSAGLDHSATLHALTADRYQIIAPGQSRWALLAYQGCPVAPGDHPDLDLNFYSLT